MNIKQHYCKVNQDQANEAMELLIKAGEFVGQSETSFKVNKGHYILQSINNKWFIYGQEKHVNTTDIKLTYPQFKEMLNAKIKEDEN